MRHPFENVRPERRAVAMIPVVVVTLALMVALIVAGAPLNTETTPLGMIDLELCWDAACAQRVLAAWGDHGLIVAAFTLGLDYAFLIAYGNAAAMAAIFAAPSSWMPAARLAAWAAWSSMALDAIENTALWWVIDGDPGWAIVAGIAAPPKFALVFGALLFALVAVVMRRRTRALNR